MIKAVWTALGVAVLAGCGGSGPQGVLAAPHGGLLVMMPENKGYVEVVKRPAESPGGLAQVAFYFLDLSRNPLSPPPASASLKVRSARNPKPIELKAGEGGALETPPAAGQGEIEGDLLFTLEGKPVAVPVNIR